MGEPLAVGLTLHFLRQHAPQAQCISMKVTQGTRAGTRLDAWISDGERTLYQTEIKMWGGNAIGGLQLKKDHTPEELVLLGQKQWQSRLWNMEAQNFRDMSVGKVLTPMQKPKGFETQEVQPLLCLWWLVVPQEESAGGAWFTLPVQGAAFPAVNVFSLTRYLMSLSEDTLKLELPLLASRFDWLQRIFPDWNPANG